MLAVISLAFIFMTFRLPVSRYSTVIGPKVFPYIAAGGLLLCSIALFFKRESEKEKAREPFLNRDGWLRFAKLISLLITFPLMFKYLGFILSSLVLLFIMITLFDLKKEETFLKKALSSFSVTAVLYVLFIYVIKVRLPMGDLLKLLF